MRLHTETAGKRFAMADQIKAIEVAANRAAKETSTAKPKHSPIDLTPLQQKQVDGVMGRIQQRREQAAKPLPVFDWQHAGNSLNPVLDGNWLVKKFLPAEGLAVMYGRPGCGKSFIGTDIALHIASGMAWRGHKSKQCEVSYVASEGGLSGVNRIHAWCGENGLAWPAAFRLTGVSLDLRSTAEHADALISDVKATQPDCRLIIVDTLNRNFGGGSENEDDAMGAFVGHCDHVAKTLNCLVLILHHSGKDSSRGARGHSSLLGAVSTEIEIVRDQGLPGCIKITKQRDAEDGQEFGFVLKPVTLGADSDGEPVTSCTVLEAEVDPKSRQPGGKNQRAVESMFTNFLADCGKPTPPEPGFPEPGKFYCVELEAFVEFVAGKLTCSEPRKAARRSVNGLVDRQILAINAGKLWFIK